MSILRERAADVRDVARRVIGILAGRQRESLELTGGSAAILAAPDLDASEIAVLRPQLVSGIALGGGAPTGHAAIVARAIGIPMVLALGASLDTVLEGAFAAVDGDSGTLLVEPSDAELTALRERARRIPSRVRRAAASSTVISATSRFAANIGSVREARAGGPGRAPRGSASSAPSCCSSAGNGRPASTSSAPSTRPIRGHMSGRPSSSGRSTSVETSRAFVRRAQPEANPALGVRGLRLGLGQPELLETQLRALLEAAAGEQLDVMFPMVATLEELDAARCALDRSQ